MSKSPLNVNSATVAQLRAVSGIGDALAKRMVADRQLHGPFADARALIRVRGIGQHKAAELAPALLFAKPTDPDFPLAPAASRAAAEAEEAPAASAKVPMTVDDVTPDMFKLAAAPAPISAATSSLTATGARPPAQALWLAAGLLVLAMATGTAALILGWTDIALALGGSLMVVMLLLLAAKFLLPDQLPDIGLLPALGLLLGAGLLLPSLVAAASNSTAADALVLLMLFGWVLALAGPYQRLTPHLPAIANRHWHSLAVAGMVPAGVLLAAAGGWATLGAILPNGRWLLLCWAGVMLGRHAMALLRMLRILKSTSTAQQLPAAETAAAVRLQP